MDGLNGTGQVTAAHSAIASWRDLRYPAAPSNSGTKHLVDLIPQEFGITPYGTSPQVIFFLGKAEAFEMPA